MLGLKFIHVSERATAVNMLFAFCCVVWRFGNLSMLHMTTKVYYMTSDNGSIEEILLIHYTWLMYISLCPTTCGSNSKSIIFKLIRENSSLGTREILLRQMPQNLLIGTLTLIQLMAWCRKVISHDVSQCWLRSMSPYGFTRLQCLNKQ